MTAESPLTTATTTQNQDIDWDFIADTIHEEKCIVFIGPEVFSVGTDVRLEQQLMKHLQATGPAYVKAFYPDDGLMLFHQGKTMPAWMKIKEFYRRPVSSATGEILQLLAQLPFHFVISLTPDSHVKNAFTRYRGVEPDFDFYWKSGEARKVDKAPTASQPLVYNLFGSADNQASMVLTHNDLYDYFESVFLEKSMPIKYKDNLAQAYNFIFLGVDFSKWYMHILLRVLRVHTDKDALMRFAVNHGVNDELMSFCNNEFQIQFVPNGDIREFLAELKSKYADRYMRGGGGGGTGSTVERIRQLAAHGKMAEAFGALDDFLDKIGEPAKDIRQDVSVLSGSYFIMKRKEDMGTLDSRDLTTQTASILNGLMTYIDQAQAFENR